MSQETSLQLNEMIEHVARGNLREEALTAEDRESLNRRLAPALGADFFNLEAGYFPSENLPLLPAELMVRLGVVPLGFKSERSLFSNRKVFNVGCLDPESARASLGELRAAVSRAHPGAEIRLFFVHPDQFAQVLEARYLLTGGELSAPAAHPVLRRYLECRAFPRSN
jgi:hypothetical protein